MPEEIRVGDRVKVYFNSKSWQDEGWFEGQVVKIEPYSQHRSFYWVELDGDISGAGNQLISVLNPKNIKRLSEE